MSREVGPVEQLSVSCHPALEFGARVVMSGGDFMKDPARRSISTGIACPSQTEGQVHVLVIGNEERIEPADSLQGDGAIEGTRAARAEDTTTGMPGPSRLRLAVAPFEGPAGDTVAVACGIDAIGSERTRTRGATDPTLASANGANPASTQPGVTSVSLFRSCTNSPLAAAIPSFAAEQNPPFRSRRTRRTNG